MDWKDKATTKSTIVEAKIPAYIHKTIRPTKPIDIFKITNPDIEWQPENKKPMKIETPFGIIWFKSNNCIQITHVKNTEQMECLENFVYDILFRKEEHPFITWLKAQVEWDDFKEEVRKFIEEDVRGIKHAKKK